LALKSTKFGTAGVFRFATSLTLSSIGAAGTASVIGLFYALYAHLPGSMSILWRGFLGGSFVVAAIGLIMAWLSFLYFAILHR